MGELYLEVIKCLREVVLSMFYDIIKKLKKKLIN